MEKEYVVDTVFTFKTQVKVKAKSKKEALLLVKHCTCGMLSIQANSLVTEYEQIPTQLHEGLEQRLENISWEMTGERPTSVKIMHNSNE